MKARSPDLTGSTALVTGAGKRIGRSLALGLARAGVNVVAHYNRSRAEIDQVAGEIAGCGARAWTVEADLGEPDQVADVFVRVREMAGPVHILINNASIFPADTVRDATVESITLNAQVNAVAPLVLSRDFAAQGIPGHILNLLDTRVVDYDARHFAYHLSKRTLFTLTRILAAELAPAVKVNGIAPGLILPPEGQDESYLENLAHTNPLQCYGDAEDIVEAALFLLRSRFITGQIIYVDGGRHMKGAFYGGC